MSPLLLLSSASLGCGCGCGGGRLPPSSPPPPPPPVTTRLPVSRSQRKTLLAEAVTQLRASPVISHA